MAVHCHKENKVTVQKSIPTSTVKEVVALGSLLNSVKASAGVVELAALTVNQAAMLGLTKIQMEAIESAREAGWDCQSLEDLRALNQSSIAAARAAYK
jgi:hypothetical protein